MGLNQVTASSLRHREILKKKGSRMTTSTVQITHGPSREELFDALRLFDEFRKVEFTLESSVRVSGTRKVPEIKCEAQIMSLAAEDGSGNNWIFTARFRKVDGSYSSREGFFNTRDRKGFLRPLV